MKQNTATDMLVRIDNTEFSDTNYSTFLSNISRIDFIFKQYKDKRAPAIKKAVYPASAATTGVDAVTKSGGYFHVPWSEADTYKFREDEPFYMDTDISYTVNSTTTKIESVITEIYMNPTLFKEDE